jgi:PII-like signaling protein
MELTGQAKLLRAYLGESDKVRHRPLYEILVQEAKSAGLAGATVSRGIMAYGASARVRTSHALDLSTDLPVIVEIIDQADRIDGFLETVHRLFEESRSGGMVIVDDVVVHRYMPGDG